MTAYRLTGNRHAPFAQMVCRTLTHKSVPFTWETRETGDARSIALTTSDGTVLSGGATILFWIETQQTEPACLPPDPSSAALCDLLIHFAGQWLNKSRVQQRWGAMPDRQFAAERLRTVWAETGAPGGRVPTPQAIAARMLDQMAVAGIEPESHKTLVASYRRFALRLNQHLQHHLYLFGGQPSLADFALAAQIGQMLEDPTPGDWLRMRAPFVAAWSDMMQTPCAAGSFAAFDTLAPTLLPVLEGELMRTWLPWALANAASAERGRARFSVTLADGLYEQATDRGAALSLVETRDRLRALAGQGGLERWRVPASPFSAWLGIAAAAA